MEIFPFLTPPTLEIPQRAVPRDNFEVWWMSKPGMVPAHTPIAFGQIIHKQLDYLLGVLFLHHLCLLRSWKKGGKLFWPDNIKECSLEREGSAGPWRMAALVEPEETKVILDL